MSDRIHRTLKRYADVEWTGEIDTLIGTVPDRVVSQRFGIATRSVHQRRRRLQKKSELAPRTDVPRWNRKLDTLIGVLPDKQISDQFRVSRVRIRVYRALHRIAPAEYDKPTIHDM